MKIGFNKPFFVGNELAYIADSIKREKISGNGYYTSKCQEYFVDKYKFPACFLTTSCTDALEMCSILIECGPEDEIIVPSYTFTSTANPFILRGAKVVFADSYPNHPNIDPDQIELLITSKTKAIVVVHYAGMSCDMDRIMELASKYDLVVIEDAAQAIDSFYKGKPLGSFGQLATFSFHETKNIISGEGGMLVVNDLKYRERTEIIWEKGTNRAAFFRGDVGKYNWVDVGSSFLPSEITSAFLYAQLEELEKIQKKRIQLWRFYHDHLIRLSEKGNFRIVETPDFGSLNGHLFAIVCNSIEVRNELLKSLTKKGICAVFHYLSLHDSPFFMFQHDGPELANANRFSNCLIRLPMYYELKLKEQEYIVEAIQSFYS